MDIELDIDKFTFGNSKCAVNLISILNKEENSQYRHKSLRILSKYMKGIGALMFVTDKDTRETALKIWLERFKLLTRSANIPTLIETHLNCVATTEYRKRRANLNTPHTSPRTE